MSVTTIARRYAEALADVAIAREQVVKLPGRTYHLSERAHFAFEEYRQNDQGEPYGA